VYGLTEAQKAARAQKCRKLFRRETDFDRRDLQLTERPGLFYFVERYATQKIICWAVSTYQQLVCAACESFAKRCRAVVKERDERFETYTKNKILYNGFEMGRL
jgi:hypothetical protein